MKLTTRKKLYWFILECLVALTIASLFINTYHNLWLFIICLTWWSLGWICLGVSIDDDNEN